MVLLIVPFNHSLPTGCVTQWNNLDKGISVTAIMIIITLKHLSIIVVTSARSYGSFLSASIT